MKDTPSPKGYFAFPDLDWYRVAIPASSQRLIHPKTPKRNDFVTTQHAIFQK